MIPQAAAQTPEQEESARRPARRLIQAIQRHWTRSESKDVFKRQHGQTWVLKPRRATESSQEPNPGFPGENLQDGDQVWVFNLLGDTDGQA